MIEPVLSYGVGVFIGMVILRAAGVDAPIDTGLTVWFALSVGYWSARREGRA